MPEGEIKKYTLKEIEEHSSKESLWLLIENGVYDVSKFMEEHPGGPEPLLDWAGKDATDAFEDVGHSVNARELMSEYKVGELCEEERKEKKANGTSSCFWYQVLIPVGVVTAAFLIYSIYTRLHK